MRQPWQGRWTTMNNLTRKIVFINIPHIFIEAEKLRRKWDESAPCAVASGDSGTSMIIDFSDSLRPGIRKGMFLKNIEEHVNIIKADYDYIKEINNMIIAYLRDYSIMVESNYFGEFYIDLTGTERLFGRIMDTCGKILRGLNDLYGFNAGIGIAGNKLIAYMASAIAGSNSVCEIFKHSENIFLAPLKIKDLPDVPDDVKRDIVSNYNIRIISELKAFSKSDLNALFKKHGDLLHEYSRNIAPDYITEKKKEKKLVRTLVLSDTANDDRVIRRKFFHLMLDACVEMRRENIFPLIFALKIIYKDDYEYSRSRGIDNPTFMEKKIYGVLLPYLNDALSRRICIKRIKLSFSDFIPAAIQESLFHDNRDLNLCRAFDSIRDKFGKRAIYFAE
jgi:DNA polymerase-4